MIFKFKHPIILGIIIGFVMNFLLDLILKRYFGIVTINFRIITFIVVILLIIVITLIKNNLARKS
ncbi:cell shape-determining protein MreD [Clostridium sardiniense]|nr:cell shape-determining protein MreD [Clostridium sardiniense]